MTKSLLTIVASLLMTTLQAQTTYKVSTETQKKKVLLEEFTGQGCYWCTDGHKVAAQLLHVMGDNAYVVSVHTGHLSGEFEGMDLRTEMGEALGEYFDCETAGFPSGMINRTDFTDGGVYTLSRSYWIDAARWTADEDAPVNLYQEATYDGETNELTVHVEGYFRSAYQSPVQNLNVIITQSGIIGYQNGGGSDYEHKHVLRANLTPVWGEQFDDVTPGTYFVRDYTYTVPTEKVKGVVTKPEDLEVLSFVTAGNADVLNITGGKPDYVNYGTELAAKLGDPDITIGNRYGYNFFEVSTRNMSTQGVSSLTFDVTVNGETTRQEVSCDLQTYGEKVIRIPATYTYAERGKTKAELTLVAMNGQDIEPQSYSCSFSKPKEVEPTIDIQIMTDNAPEQNHWLLKDADGNLIQELGPYTEKGATYNETITVERGKTYCIEVTDEYGDGLASGKRGGLVVHDSNGTLIDQLYQINGWGVRSFFSTVGGDDGISQATTAVEDAACYDLAGRRIDQPRAKGIYIKGGKKTVIR